MRKPWGKTVSFKKIVYNFETPLENKVLPRKSWFSIYFFMDTFLHYGCCCRKSSASTRDGFLPSFSFR